MDYRTTRGEVVSLLPIALTDRDKFTKCREVADAAIRLEEKEDNSEEWYNARFNLHDRFLELCDLCEVPRVQVSEGDITNILVILQTGELPRADFQTPGE